MSCILRATGERFNAQKFLEGSGLPRVTLLDGTNRLKLRGFTVHIGGTFGSLPSQLRSARLFLLKHQQILRKIVSNPGITERRLIFSYTPRNAVGRDELFPAEFLKQLATFKLDLSLSVYAGPKWSKPRNPADDALRRKMLARLRSNELHFRGP